MDKSIWHNHLNRVAKKCTPATKMVQKWYTYRIFRVSRICTLFGLFEHLSNVLLLLDPYST